MNARDPVCGMAVDPAKAAAHITHKERNISSAARNAPRSFAPIPKNI